MKKLSLCIGGVVLSISMAAVFSLGGCKNTTSAETNESAKTTEATTVSTNAELPELPSSLSIKINPISNLSPDFIKGVDVSMLAQIEKSGGKLYDTDGEQKDCLLILKNHGVNWIRLRLWNNPVFTADRIALENLAAGNDVKPGDPVGGGNCDLESMKGLAKRAKALGMKVLLDFHYSDTTTYTVSTGKEMPKISATVADNGRIVIVPPLTLPGAAIVSVTSEEGLAQKTYYIDFILDN
jgi:arabinogalactan endo-1,4-beta-galactosidase